MPSFQSTFTTDFAPGNPAAWVAGVFALPAGQQTGHIAFATPFAAKPSVLLPAGMELPDGTSVLLDTKFFNLTQDGFDYVLTTDDFGAGYNLHYLALA